MKRKIYRNLLVQYKGGGYDGCYWEWNYFLFDSKGKFHNLISSGRNGIQTKDEAKAILKAKKNSWGRIETEFYKYDLTKKSKIKEFQKEVSESHVSEVIKLVNKIYNKDLMYFECDACETKSYGEMFHDGYKGNGGIGVVMLGKICEDCYCSGLCENCNEYDSTTTYSLSHDQALCEHCIGPNIVYFPLNEWGKRNDIAIHLKEPDEHALEDAKQVAARDNFKLICVYRGN